MKRVLILKPRFDVPFKNLGPIPETRGPIAPIRQHWLKLIDQIEAEHKRRGDEVAWVERPLWQFEPEFVQRATPDICYVPHREITTFPLGVGIDTRYYMQSVFPWQFYIDSLGFAGGSKLWRNPQLYSLEDRPSTEFDKLVAYIESGKSKFPQPDRGIFSPDSIGKEYVLWICQLPHDQTVQYHSDVSSEGALHDACETTKKLGITLLVKGHPINLASMQSQREIAQRYDHTIWIEESYNIHDLIKYSKAVVCVNSGCGMEAILQLRPVYVYGRCEYDVIAEPVTIIRPEGQMVAGYPSLKNLLRKVPPELDRQKVVNFIDNWVRMTYDCDNEADFRKLP